MTNIIDITVRAKDESRAGLSSAEKSTGKVRTALKGIGTVAGGVLAAGAIQGIGRAVTSSFQAADDWNRAQGQTNAVLKSTQGIANVTADHVRKLAGNIEDYSTFSDGAIQDGENLILTFKNIRNEAGKGNDIFDQTVGIMADMSQALGQDTKTSAVQLGKALNDPIKGTSALQRVGVTFTDKQKALIKKLVESGDTMGAQKIILGELKDEFGDSAKKAGDTQPYKKLQNKLSDVGRAVALKVLPMINQLADWAGKHMGIVKAFLAVAGAIGAIMIAAKVVNAVKTLGSVLGLLTSPVGLVVLALAAIAIGFYEAWTHSAKFRDIVIKVFSVTGQAVLTFAGIWLKVIQTIVGIWMTAVGTILNGAAAAFGWVPGVGPKLRAAADKFNGFKNDVNHAFDAARGKISQWKDDLARLPKTVKLKGDIKDLTNKLVQAKRKVTDPNLTKTRRAQIQANITDLQRKIAEAHRQLNGLHGKTVTVTQRMNFIRTTWNITHNNVYTNYLSPHASGGPVGAAATGGPRGNRVLVGENGPEVVDLPTGSLVHPSANTRSMMRGGGATFVFEVGGNGSDLDRMFLEWLRKTVRVKGGGNVQVAFGRG